MHFCHSRRIFFLSDLLAVIMLTGDGKKGMSDKGHMFLSHPSVY